MTTKLDSALKREISIAGVAYTVTVSPESFSLVLKGRRKGLEIRWVDLVSGETALATALNASLTANIMPGDHAKPTAKQPPSPAPKLKPARARPDSKSTLKR